MSEISALKTAAESAILEGKKLVSNDSPKTMSMILALPVLLCLPVTVRGRSRLTKLIPQLRRFLVPWAALLVKVLLALSSLSSVMIRSMDLRHHWFADQLESQLRSGQLPEILIGFSVWSSGKEKPRIAGFFHYGLAMNRTRVIWQDGTALPSFVGLALLSLIAAMLLSTVIHYGVSPNWHDQQRIFQLLLLSGSSLFFLVFSFFAY